MSGGSSSSHSTFARHFLICGLDTAAGLELDDAAGIKLLDMFLAVVGKEDVDITLHIRAEEGQTRKYV